MTGGKGSCGTEKPLDLYIGVSNLILDVAAVALPMPVLWGLKMNVGKKVMLSGMFGMGITYATLLPPFPFTLTSHGPLLPTSSTSRVC